MRLSTAPIQVAGEDNAQPAVLARTAAVITFVGCALTLLASILPWGERATFGFSLTTVQGENARILLAVLAVASASLVAIVLLRRSYSPAAAIALVGLALAQVGASIWFGVNVVNEIRVAHPELLLISAIGTGVYMAALGSMGTLIGAIMAWTRRRID